MGTCKTCKHWGFKKDNEWTAGDSYTHPDDPDGGKMKMPFEVHSCGHPKLLFCERPIESNGFSVADGSGYMAALITAEDFGCIQHEGKL